MKAKLIKFPDEDWVVEVPEDSKGIKGSMVQGHFASTFGHGYKLSLKNCQAIERGYDLDELAMEKCNNPDLSWENDYARENFKAGFQKALELMGDKKFSDEDVKNIFAKTLENAPSTESHTRMISDVQYRHFVMDELYDRITKSLQTEWDVEVEMICPHPSDTYKCGIQYGCDEDGCNHPNKIPLLDSDGCLILKLKSE